MESKGTIMETLLVYFVRMKNLQSLVNGKKKFAGVSGRVALSL